MGDANPYRFTYSQDIDFDTELQSVAWATLTLTHKYNRNNPNESWFLKGSGIFLGQLESSQSGWYADVFDITYLLNSITGTVALLENTNENSANDTLWIDSSVISGEFAPRLEVTGFDALHPEAAPVPEPSPLLLFGTGILGLAVMARKRCAACNAPVRKTR